MSEIAHDPRGVSAMQSLSYSTTRISRAFARFTENVALAEGLTLSQFLVVQVLGEGLPLSNAHLARRTFVSPQAAHTVSKELLDRGLIERRSHPSNARLRLVQLTDAGWEIFTRCGAQLREHEERLSALLGDDTTEVLRETLRRAAKALEGGYFGNDEEEAAAIARRSTDIRPRHVPSRLAAVRLRAALDRPGDGA